MAMEIENNLGDWFEITSSSEKDMMEKLRDFSNKLFSSSLPENVCGDVMMAVEEIARNGMEWGNQYSEKKKVRISYCFYSDCVIIKCEDEGEGFNYKEITDPTQNLENHVQQRKSERKRVGGFGIHILKQIMDSIIYNEKGNICLLTKSFQQ